MDAPRAGRLAALVVVGTLAVLWWRVLIGNDAIATSYFQDHVVPEQLFAAITRADGRLPAWWDQIALGVPFAAVLDRATFYPPSMLLALAPGAHTIHLFLLAHALGFALGAAVFARRLGADGIGGALAGALAAGSGLATSAILLGPTIIALAWLPWVLIAADRLVRRSAGPPRQLAGPLALLATTAAMMALGGDLHLAVAGAIAALALSLRGARRARAAILVAIALVLAAAAAAIALVPAVLVDLTTPRSGFAELGPRRILELAWAAARPHGDRGDPAHLGGGLASLHLGLPVVLVAGYAVVAGFRRLGIAALVALALATAAAWLGPLGGVAGAAIAPGLLVLCALAGAGGAALARAAAARKGWLGVAAPLGVAIIAGWPATEFATVVELAPREELDRPPALIAETVTAGERLYRPLVMAGAPTGDRARVAAWDHRMLAGARAARYGLTPLRPLDPGEDADWRTMWRAAGSAGERLFDLVGVERAILPATVARAMSSRVLGEDGEWVLAEVPARRPRAFVASAARRLASTDAVLAALFPAAAERRRRLDPGEIRLLGAPSSSPPAEVAVAPSSPSPCAIQSFRPERVELICEAAVAGHAVLLDAVASGWSATVDGAPAAIESADLIGRAVALPAGRHRVAFDYVPPGLRFGAAIGLFAWLDIGLLALIGWRARRQRPSASGGNPDRAVSGEISH